MAQFSLSNLRFILDTEDQADQPVSEELLQQLRENIEVLFMLLSDTGVSGSATEDPPDDTTGVLTDGGSPAAFEVDEHNERSLLITSGIAKNTIYTIDDTTETTLVCTDDNLYSAGVRSGDTYKILYDVKVNTDGHNHDGINSAEFDLITQAKLKTSQGSVTDVQGSATYANHTLPGGEYGFYPQLKAEAVNDLSAMIADTMPTEDAYVTTIAMKTEDAGVGHTIWAQQRYVTASGEIHWVFILRDKITKNILSMWQAPDHPCFGNGGKPLLLSHPFGDYDPIKHEIVVINPTKEEVRAIQNGTVNKNEKQPNRDFLEIVLEKYEIDEISNPQWPDKEVTVGLPADWDEAWLSSQPVQPIKKVIPKPDYVVCKSLKLKDGKAL